MLIDFQSKELPKTSIKTNGRIKNAIDAYRSKQVPLRLLLTNFLAVKSKGDELAEADNSWAYFYKGIEGYEVESGVSVDESLFRFSTMEIKNEKPTDVINASFYSNKKGNDSDFELGYLLPIFTGLISENDSILMVNPTPDMIIEIEESGRVFRKKTYAVPDETVANLYKIQFPNSDFITFRRFQNVHDIDAILIANRDQKLTESCTLLNCLKCCNDNATVIGLIPNTWFDNNKSGAGKALKDLGFSIKQVMIVDPSATASTPKKKLIVVMEKGEESEVKVYRSLYESRTRMFTVLDDVITINENEYLSSDKTIISE